MSVIPDLEVRSIYGKDKRTPAKKFVVVGHVTTNPDVSVLLGYPGGAGIKCVREDMIDQSLQKAAIKQPNWANEITFIDPKLEFDEKWQSSNGTWLAFDGKETTIDAYRSFLAAVYQKNATDRKEWTRHLNTDGPEEGNFWGLWEDDEIWKAYDEDDPKVPFNLDDEVVCKRLATAWHSCKNNTGVIQEPRSTDLKNFRYSKRLEKSRLCTESSAYQKWANSKEGDQDKVHKAGYPSFAFYKDPVRWFARHTSGVAPGPWDATSVFEEILDKHYHPPWRKY